MELVFQLFLDFKRHLRVSKRDIGIRRTTIKERDIMRKSVMSIAAMRDKMYLSIGFS